MFAQPNNGSPSLAAKAWKTAIDKCLLSVIAACLVDRLTICLFANK
jgi:hypothetical protein